jgi:hypothetical protein
VESSGSIIVKADTVYDDVAYDAALTAEMINPSNEEYTAEKNVEPSMTVGGAESRLSKEGREAAQQEVISDDTLRQTVEEEYNGDYIAAAEAFSEAARTYFNAAQELAETGEYYTDYEPEEGDGPVIVHVDADEMESKWAELEEYYERYTQAATRLSAMR